MPRASRFPRTNRMKTRLTLDSLEERVVPTTVGTSLIPTLYVRHHFGAEGNSSPIVYYGTSVDHGHLNASQYPGAAQHSGATAATSTGGAAGLKTQYQAKVDQISARIQHRTQQFAVGYAAALSGAGHTSVAQVKRDYNNLVNNVNRQVRQADAMFNRDLGQTATSTAAASTTANNLRGIAGAIGQTLRNEAAGARASAQAMVTSASTSPSQAQTTGHSLTTQAASMASSDRATINGLLGQYDRALGSLGGAVTTTTGFGTGSGSIGTGTGTTTTGTGYGSGSSGIGTGYGSGTTGTGSGSGSTGIGTGYGSGSTGTGTGYGSGSTGTGTTTTGTGPIGTGYGSGTTGTGTVGTGTGTTGIGTAYGSGTTGIGTVGTGIGTTGIGTTGTGIGTTGIGTTGTTGATGFSGGTGGTGTLTSTGTTGFGIA